MRLSEWLMVMILGPVTAYGDRVSGQDARPHRDGSGGRNSFTPGSHQLIEGQAGLSSGRARRTVAKKLEKLALRKDGGAMNDRAGQTSSFA